MIVKISLSDDHLEMINPPYFIWGAQTLYSFESYTQTYQDYSSATVLHGP